MAEIHLNSRLLKILKEANLYPMRVENSARAGTPDIFAGRDIWIESKYVKKWPHHKESALKIDHFTSQQRCWHVERKVAGGKSFVILQVQNEIMVFNGAKAAVFLGKVNRIELIQNALLFTNYLDPTTLVHVLQS
jgi:hypothetical protein